MLSELVACAQYYIAITKVQDLLMAELFRHFGIRTQMYTMSAPVE